MRGQAVEAQHAAGAASARAFARFLRHDSREENLKLLWAYLTRYGRPLEIYTGLDTVFAVSEGEAARRKPGGRYHDWNENFDLHKAPPICVATQPSGARKDSE